MKNNIKQMLKFSGGIIFLLFLITSCNKQNELGLEILPSTDLINVKNTVIKDKIKAYANNEFGIVTNKEDYNLLGSINDPLFGNTTAGFATQFRIRSYTNFGSNPTADSTFLFLYYKTVYGDTVTQQNLKVYELETMIYNELEYKQDIDLKSMSSDEVIGGITFIPKIAQDSAGRDTSYQELKIMIDNSFGQKLISADSADMVIIDTFLEKICKGIYIEAEKVNTPESGSLVTLETTPTIDFKGSALLVYYNNDENKNTTVEEQDTLFKAYIITENSARISSIQHDYTGAPFVNDLDQKVEQEEHIYIQPTGGLKSYITINDLEGWRDSVNIAINKAELVFQVDTIESNIEKYPPPSNLSLTFLDKDSVERRPIDYYFHPAFHDGYLREDYTYHFNITQHVQRVINVLDPEDEDYVGNQGFFLTTGQRSSNAQRVVMEGTGREGGVKLIITYSEYLK